MMAMLKRLHSTFHHSRPCGKEEGEGGGGGGWEMRRFLVGGRRKGKQHHRLEVQLSPQFVSDSLGHLGGREERRGEGGGY